MKKKKIKVPKDFTTNYISFPYEKITVISTTVQENGHSYTTVSLEHDTGCGGRRYQYFAVPISLDTVKRMLVTKVLRRMA